MLRESVKSFYHRYQSRSNPSDYGKVRCSKGIHRQFLGSNREVPRFTLQVLVVHPGNRELSSPLNSANRMAASLRQGPPHKSDLTRTSHPSHRRPHKAPQAEPKTAPNEVRPGEALFRDEVARPTLPQAGQNSHPCYLHHPARLSSARVRAQHQ